MGPEALPAVVAMIAANDRDVLREPAVLSQLAPRSEWPHIEQAADALDRIWREFDYLDSPEFEKQSQGRSSAALSLLKKLSGSPERRREAKARLERLLASGTASQELLHLLPPTAHESLLSAFALLRPNNSSQYGS